MTLLLLAHTIDVEIRKQTLARHLRRSFFNAASISADISRLCAEPEAPVAGEVRMGEATRGAARSSSTELWTPPQLDNGAGAAVGEQQPPLGDVACVRTLAQCVQRATEPLLLVAVPGATLYVMLALLLNAGSLDAATVLLNGVAISFAMTLDESAAQSLLGPIEYAALDTYLEQVALRAAQVQKCERTHSINATEIKLRARFRALVALGTLVGGFVYATTLPCDLLLHDVFRATVLVGVTAGSLLEEFVCVPQSAGRLACNLVGAVPDIAFGTAVVFFFKQIVSSLYYI
jgi:hypothetical protein